MDYKRIKEKINKSRQNEFDEAFEKYSKEVECYSGGLISTDKADFIKLIAFYKTVIIPQLDDFNQKMFETLLK